MKAIISSIILMTTLGLAQEEQYLNELSPAEEAAGFELLWDGEKVDDNLLANWNGGSMNWVLDDNALLCLSQGESNSLCTRKEYSSFEFRFDMKLGNANQNSGVFYLLPDFGANILSCGEMGIQGEPHDCNYECHTGDNYHMQYASEYPQVMEEYNTVRMLHNGNFIEWWINGIKVNEFEMFSDTWFSQLQADGKYPQDRFCRENGQPTSEGILCVQDHGPGLTDQFWMRNLKIRTFEPGGQVPIPVIEITQISEDSADASMDVGMIGAEIRYTLDGSTPDNNSELYIGPFGLNRTTTINVSAFKNRFSQSEMVTEQFTSLSVWGCPDSNYAEYIPDSAHAKENDTIIRTRDDPNLCITEVIKFNKGLYPLLKMSENLEIKVSMHGYYRISIIDARGKIIVTRKGSNIQNFKLKPLNKGIYIIRVVGYNRILTQQFVLF
jgi:hypothetical protein